MSLKKSFRNNTFFGVLIALSLAISGFAEMAPTVSKPTFGIILVPAVRARANLTSEPPTYTATFAFGHTIEVTSTQVVNNTTWAHISDPTTPSKVGWLLIAHIGFLNDEKTYERANQRAQSDIMNRTQQKPHILSWLSNPTSVQIAKIPREDLWLTLAAALVSAKYELVASLLCEAMPVSSSGDYRVPSLSNLLLTPIVDTPGIQQPQKLCPLLTIPNNLAKPFSPQERFLMVQTIWRTL